MTADPTPIAETIEDLARLWNLPVRKLEDVEDLAQKHWRERHHFFIPGSGAR